MYRRKQKLPNYLTTEEQRCLLTTAKALIAAARSARRHNAARRNLMMVRTQLSLGLRVSELCKLQVGDVNLTDGVVKVVEGKGGKDRVVPVARKFLEKLRKWIGERTEGAVFPGPLGRKLTTRAVQSLYAKLGAAAGLTKRLRTHTLRHTFAMRLLEAGVSIYEIKELLGHSDISTTAVYLHATPDRLKSAVQKLEL